MDFKALGTSLISTFAEERLIEYFNRKQLSESIVSQMDMSSTSLVTRNIAYQSSSSMSRQQIFKIHVDSVDLTDAALKALNGKYRKCLGIRVCWHFMNFDSTTPIIQAKEKHVKINDLQEYNITLNDVFVSYIAKRTIHFELYGTYEVKEKHLGRAEMDLQDLLYCPDKDIPKYLDISTVNKNKMFKKCKSNTIIGNLSLKYCLKADSSSELPNRISNVEVKELFHKVGQKVSSDLSSYQDGIEDESVCKRPQRKSLPASTTTQRKETNLGASLSDYSFCHNILNKVVDGDEFSTSIKEERDKRLHKQKINFKKSLEEYAILSGLSPTNIGVPTTYDIKVRDYEALQNYESAVIINIMSLYMNEIKYPIITPDAKELYVEYSFLSRSGRDMETLSLPLLEDRIIEFNFKRTFLIDSGRNRYDCKILAKFIKEKKSIRFMVIEEPAEELNKFQICKEIGFAEVNLFKLVQGEDNIVTDLYPVIDLESCDEQIGYLKISIYGIQAMRNAALKILTPCGQKVRNT